MGQDTYFPGANDNASGVAEMLALAAAFEKVPLKHNLLFIAFAGEEAGLLGSTFYVNNPLVPLDSTDFVLNLDLSGTGDEGITLVNGSVYEKEYALLDSLNTELNAVASVKKRGPAANSDHYPFYVKGVPSFFIYTRGGIKAYHDIYDKSETLPLDKADELLRLYKAFFIALDKIE
jgi:Zn-dependent M28 family amino/carboxypeptidase